MKMVSRSAFFVAVGVSVWAAGTAIGQPVRIEHRRALIMSDQGDAPFDGLFIFKDTDGDGLALDPSEGHVWFDRTNAQGYLGETSNFLAVHATYDAFVYAFDADSRALYRLRDENADGDALDASESTSFFDNTNAAGIPIGPVNGVFSDDEGAIYICAAGSTANNEPDAVIRLVDINDDGDANDAGEATIWADLQAFDGGDSVSFEIVFKQDGTAYYIEYAGAPDTIRRLRDDNENGVIDANERTVFFTDGEFGIDLGLALASDGDSLLVNDNSGSDQGVWRLTDLNESGVIDSVDEVELLWREDQNADGITIGVSFDFEIGFQGRIYLLDSGTPDSIVVLTSLNRDGDFNDAGETRTYAQGKTHGFDRPRSLTFLPRLATRAELTDFEIITGSLLDGGLDELNESDDAYLHTRSTFGFSVIEPSLMVAEFGFTGGADDPTTVDFTVEQRINHPTGTVTFSLRNWTGGGSFQVVAGGPIGPTEQVYTISGLDSFLYVRPSDQRIEMRIKHVVIAVFSALGFDSYFDEINMQTVE